jgi:hypothetical protein
MNSGTGSTFIATMDATERLHESLMTDAEYERKLDEVDRILNDPDVPMEPSRIWSLLAEIACREPAAHPAGP